MSELDGQDSAAGLRRRGHHRYVRVERQDGGAICERCLVADTPLARLKGLLGRSTLEPGEGLLLSPISSIHTCFMRFPIDAVFLDRDFVVLEISAGLQAWRVASHCGARHVLELPAGACARNGIQSGERLRRAATV
jgi:uncharacterized protein